MGDGCQMVTLNEILRETPTSNLIKLGKNVLKVPKFGENNDYIKEKFFCQQLYSKFKQFTIEAKVVKVNGEEGILMENMVNRGYSTPEYAIPIKLSDIKKNICILSKLHSHKLSQLEKSKIYNFLLSLENLEKHSTGVNSCTVVNGDIINFNQFKFYEHVVDNAIKDFQGILTKSQLKHLIYLKNNLKEILNIETENSVFLHGDAHPWNFIYSESDIRLIDWQTWYLGRPTNDLVHLLVMHNSYARRKALKESVLADYVSNVYNSNFELFKLHYKLSVYRQLLLVLIQRQSNKILPSVWVLNLERVLFEIEDNTYDS
ncbi:CTP:phosphocholine cytidylyltransferase involved in choline phosphorylation for cell surface LPS epitopes [Streptococcus pneumoniae]|uniref:phosphotransferase n=1 Tax=Streptococcus pneumoniae TaxID=1313 RepID=UPI00076999AF|nr:phosphotransferase [Streptococcus pneumoniae]MDS2642209.1 DUF1679 domain-containing protein [Streptococcus pneumoniae]MDS2795113.1 DUF1679 domain-containing protein [Streptococcus pneumoniae]MDS2981448.1 DUF1679 domain-containing protein [Streptococcus pneumoniae]MDS3196831.1 DUF1679 domain-containing protein [Streptococcus pneumoniae]MDS3240791.1 DUF1679 domain-containing protein [Streptococcus pneumoniae]